MSNDGVDEEDEDEEVVEQFAYSNSMVPDMQLGKCGPIQCGVNIVYIGVGLIFRDGARGVELLLVQEAKRRCYGKWYVPAGRIEPGETIVDGVIREVLEESGYQCEPETFLGVQVQGSGWYRFSFYCNITGGERKITANHESLCADWFLVDDLKAKKVNLRANDFLKIVNEALRYRAQRNEFPNQCAPILPMPVAVSGLFIQFAIARYTNDKVELLVHKDLEHSEQVLSSINPFPLVEFGFQYFFPTVVSKCFQHLIVDGRNAIEMPSELLQLQCLPSPVDGVRHGIKVCILCRLKATHQSTSLIRDCDRYRWLPVNDDVQRNLHLTTGHYRPSLHML